MSKEKSSDLHYFLKQVALIILAILAFLVLILFFLRLYTRHGKEYELGDFRGLTLEEVLRDPLNDKFEFIIIDSVFDNTKPKRTIISQSPSPRTKVKANRKIYLTIVASQPEMVACPNLQDLTVRQAAAILETYGLKVGRIEYVPDIGNTVLLWKQFGKTLSPGQKIVKGTAVDLVVGSGRGSAISFVPDLVGKTRAEAQSMISAAGLNIGNEYFLRLYDTINVRVVKQHPPYSPNAQVTIGSKIDLWYE